MPIGEESFFSFWKKNVNYNCIVLLDVFLKVSGITGIWNICPSAFFLLSFWNYLGIKNTIVKIKREKLDFLACYCVFVSLWSTVIPYCGFITVFFFSTVLANISYIPERQKMELLFAIFRSLRKTKIKQIKVDPQIGKKILEHLVGNLLVLSLGYDGQTALDGRLMNQLKTIVHPLILGSIWFESSSHLIHTEQKVRISPDFPHGITH